MLITPKLFNHSMLKNVKLRLRSAQAFMILQLKICLVFGQKKVVIIDPGHGGKDSGAIGINGTYEKDVVLNLNNSLFDNEFAIYLTRYTDTLISLSDRSRLTKILKADVFVSLHCNASRNASRDMEVYVHHSESQNTKTAITLGISILNESSQRLGFEKRGVKFANFQVLRKTISYCPAVLVEMGFMTNADEIDY